MWWSRLREDANRQHREREYLVQERVRIENRIARPFDNARHPEKPFAAVMGKGHGRNADRRRPPDRPFYAPRRTAFASPPRDDPGDDPRGGSRTRASAPVARRYGQLNDPGSAPNSAASATISPRFRRGSVLSLVREPPANRQLSRPYPNTFPERRNGSRSADQPGRQCEGAQDAHPVRLALAALSAKTAAWHAGFAKVSEICKSAPAASPTAPWHASC